MIRNDFNWLGERSLPDVLLKINLIYAVFMLVNVYVEPGLIQDPEVNIYDEFYACIIYEEWSEC